MSFKPSNGFGRLMDAFEDDLRVEVMRPRADGGPDLQRSYTKASSTLGWVPCPGKGCHLGGCDLAHELGPLVLAHQRAVAMGLGGRQVDESLRLHCSGRLLHYRFGRRECSESVTIHIVGTLRAEPDRPPAGAAGNR